MKTDIYCVTVRLVVGDDGQPDLFELLAHLEEFADPSGWQLPHWQTKIGNAFFGGRELPTAIVLVTPGTLHALKLHDITQSEVRILHSRLLTGDELDLQRKAAGEAFPWESSITGATVSEPAER